MKQLLGRVEPTDWEHFEKYSLTTAMAIELPKPVPVVVGVNWYSNFDTPIQNNKGEWWVGKGDLGYIRGGHCVVMPHNNSDTAAWHKYYNQGSEGACVGFGSSRMMSLINRKRYNAFWLWNEAKKNDEWPDTNPGDNNGTSVRAAMDILRLQGHVRGNFTAPDLKEGIAENRWAISIENLFSVLQNPIYKKIGAIPFHNSWGDNYPKKVWMPCETWHRLMNESGEFTMVTDK